MCECKYEVINVCMLIIAVDGNGCLLLNESLL